MRAWTPRSGSTDLGDNTSKCKSTECAVLQTQHQCDSVLMLVQQLKPSNTPMLPCSPLIELHFVFFSTSSASLLSMVLNLELLLVWQLVVSCNCQFIIIVILLVTFLALCAPLLPSIYYAEWFGWRFSIVFILSINLMCIRWHFYTFEPFLNKLQ